MKTLLFMIFLCVSTAVGAQTYIVVDAKGTRVTVPDNTSAIQQKYDSLRRLPGSVQVQGLKNGIWYNAFIDSVSTGGGGAETDPIVRAVIGIIKSSGTTISSAIAGTDYGRIDSIRFINSGIIHNPTAAFALSGNTGVITQSLVSQVANTFLASPNGTVGTPTFRGIAVADVPILNQNTTGNATTATVLQTSRTINGVAFNGSSNIVITDATKLSKAGDIITGDISNTSTGYFQVAAGSTAQRPSTPSDGMRRYNNTLLRDEFYSNGAWRNHVRLAGDTLTGPIAATNLSGTNTGDQTNITGNAGTATNLTGLTTTVATLNNQSGTNTGDNATNTQYSGLVSNATHTGDVTGATALTLATVNANVGTFNSITVNAKGLVVAATNVGGTGTVTSVAKGYGILPDGTITTSGTVTADTNILLTKPVADAKYQTLPNLSLSINVPSIAFANRSSTLSIMTWSAYSPTLNLYVSVGAAATTASNVKTSTDGITWVDRAFPANYQATTVVWADKLNLFVVVGQAGNNTTVYTSSDGITWTATTCPSPGAGTGWNEMVYSLELNLLVAVSSSGVTNNIMTSSDGINWTLRTKPNTTGLYSITWAAQLGKFIAMSPVQATFSSPDGINWSIVSSATIGTITRKIEWSPQLNILVSVGQSSVIGYSTNGGASFTNQTIPNLGTQGDIQFVVWSKDYGFFMAVNAGQDSNHIIYSSDGKNWNIKRLPQANSNSNIIYASKTGVFVIAGFNSSSGNIMTNSLTTSYTETDPIVKAINGIVKSNGVTISAASSSTDYALPNSVNSNYTNDYRAANFVAGTNYVAPSGSIAGTASGSYIGTQTLTSGTTYTSSSGVTKIRIRMVGAGGGGGGVTGTASQAAAAGGGGSGSYLEKVIAVTPATAYTIAIGAAGTAGASTGTAGGTGGNTTIAIGATTYTTTGGLGGSPMLTGITLITSAGGASGANSTNGDVNTGGSGGFGGIRLSANASLSGNGASSQFGAGGLGVSSANSAGGIGKGFGAGGGGACNVGNSSQAGGVGLAGIIIIDEYK